MLILIKGAGDIATGIAVRLKNAGMQVVMTEIAIPTTVRRSVAFSRAVYEGISSCCKTAGVCAKSKTSLAVMFSTTALPS